MSSKKNKDHKNKMAAKPVPPKGKRRLLFKLVALFGIPLLFLGCLEAILLLFGFGYPPGALLKHDIGDREVYCQNPQFTWRFFPRHLARQSHAYMFDVEKPPQTFRIFLLGASAAAGTPVPEYNVGRILEVLLDERYPETDFEVISAVMPAINSHVVLEIAKDCAKAEPDLFIVYLGNNEVVGPFGAGTIFNPVSPSLTAIRAILKIKTTRIGQLLDRITRSLGASGDIPTQWEGLAMFMDKQVRHDDPALKQVYRHYEQNLKDICRAAHDTGAEVILSNVVCNIRDCPPFASLHREGLSPREKETWDAFYRKGITKELNKNYAEAIKLFRAAANIDDTHAELRYRLGHCLDLVGRTVEARPHYQAARQYDTLRFRADDRINEIIESVARHDAEKGVHFVDAVSSFTDQSPTRLPGKSLFYEHVHFTFKGNYLLARSFLKQIEEVLAEGGSSPRGDILSEDRCAGRLAYTHYDRFYALEFLYHSSVNAPPFTNQLYHSQYMKEMRRQMDEHEELANQEGVVKLIETYKKAILYNPDDHTLYWRYASFLNNILQDAAAAETQLRQAIKVCPVFSSGYMALGKTLHQQNKIAESQEVLKQLMKLDPSSEAELRQVGALEPDN
jgi:tetratricopeptide (TPR) repeat protein